MAGAWRGRSGRRRLIYSKHVPLPDQARTGGPAPAGPSSMRRCSLPLALITLQNPLYTMLHCLIRRGPAAEPRRGGPRRGDARAAGAAEPGDGHQRAARQRPARPARARAAPRRAGHRAGARPGRLSWCCFPPGPYGTYKQAVLKVHMRAVGAASWPATLCVCAAARPCCKWAIKHMRSAVYLLLPQFPSVTLHRGVLATTPGVYTASCCSG